MRRPAIVSRQKVSTVELATRWGVSKGKVVAFIKSGELPAIDLSRSRNQRPRYAIDERDIEQFEQARRVQPNGTAATSRRIRRRPSGNVKEFF